MEYRFEWLVFVNGSPLPIAGFEWIDQAEDWARELYPGAYEVRANHAMQPTTNAVGVGNQNQGRGGCGIVTS